MKVLNTNRLSLLNALVSAVWLVQLLISLPLWQGTTHSCPCTPVFDFLPLNLGSYANFSIFIFLIISLLCSFFSSLFLRFSKYCIYCNCSVIVLFVLLILQDLMRLQVWVYQYIIISSILALYFCNKDEKKATGALRLVIIFTYLWSGLNKINIHFQAEVFEWLMDASEITKPLKRNTILAYFLGMFEVFVGLVLCFKKTWRFMFALVFVFHICILAILYANQWNHVVYPWNLMMIVTVGLLFFKNPLPIQLFEKGCISFSSFASKKNKITSVNISKHLLNVLIIMFLGILPTLNIFGYWGDNLSFKMYSGIGPKAVFYWNKTDDNCIPKDIQSEIVHSKTSPKNRIYLDAWTYKNFRVLTYPSPNVYKNMARKICSCIKDTANAGLQITQYPRFQKEEKRYISCHSILKERK